MAKRDAKKTLPAPAKRPSALLDTRVIYCGDNLDQLKKLPDACVDLIHGHLWHRFPTGESNSNRNYEVIWGERSEPRPLASRPLSAFEDRHASTQAYIECMRQRSPTTRSVKWFSPWPTSTAAPLAGRVVSHRD